jgi:hypothetical protein
MSDLKSIRRPCKALIKLVEAAGILLNVPMQSDKSVYKAPVPSNYDNTIEELARDFYGALQRMAGFRSESVSNATATDLLTKFFDPSFGYDEAFRDGGHYAMELFNAVVLVLDRLQDDLKRLPARANSVLVIVDGSKSSYVALDSASHVFSHGMLTVGAVSSNGTSKNTSSVPSESDRMSQYLVKDIQRRCASLYKLETHKFQILDIYASDQSELFEGVVQVSQHCNPSVIVIGCNDDNFEEDCPEKLKLWAAWESRPAIVFTKTKSKTRPFGLSHAPRSFLLCVKRLEDVSKVFESALVCLRPGDNIVVLVITESPEPCGNWRRSRFDMGSRQGWIQDSASTITKAKPGWNDEANEEILRLVYEHIDKAKVRGKVLLKAASEVTSIPQQICITAAEENVDFLVLKYKQQRNNIISCLKDAGCSVILVK